MADAFIAELRKVPPVTRIIVASTLVVSLSMVLQLVDARHVYFGWYWMKRFQLWRIYTNFFYAGTGIPLLFNTLMLYRNLNELEEQSYHRRSHDLAWQSLLACAAILLLNIPLGTGFHFPAMYICFVYLSCWLSNHPTVNMYGLVSVPTRWFPFALLFIDVISGGPRACLVGLTGCMVGHTWWLVEWKNGQRQNNSWTRSPEWLKQWVAEGATATRPATATGPEPANEARAYGGARAPNGRGFGDGGLGTGSGTTTARTGSGYQWGSGQRLGEQ